MKTLFEKARFDVGKVFANPHEIVVSRELSFSQKKELLEQWDLDLQEQLVATEENMPSNDPGKAAEMLRGVRTVLIKLKENTESGTTVTNG